MEPATIAAISFAAIALVSLVLITWVVIRRFLRRRTSSQTGAPVPRKGRSQESPSGPFPEIKAGDVLLIGRIPGSKNVDIRVADGRRSRYEWEDADGRKGDVLLDEGFLWTWGSYRFMDVDLANLHPITYEGKVDADDTPIQHGKERVDRDFNLLLPIDFKGTCDNDFTDVIEVNWLGEKKKIRSVWRRISGHRLWYTRKDNRGQFLNMVGGSFWNFMERHGKVLGIATVVTLGLMMIGGMVVGGFVVFG